MEDGGEGGDPGEGPIVVPVDSLSEGALRGVIESFVQREGTDYGREYSLEEKVDHVRRQLERGEAWITFDPETETINVVTADALA